MTLDRVRYSTTSGAGISTLQLKSQIIARTTGSMFSVMQTIVYLIRTLYVDFEVVEDSHNIVAWVM